MNSRVLTNFRDHPSLRFDDAKSVFKIEGKLYLLSEGVVQEIIPKGIQKDNIGEPYRNLVNLNFVFKDSTLNDWNFYRIHFAPEDEQALRQLISPETDAEKRIDA
jgi:hypothetical protein